MKKIIFITLFSSICQAFDTYSVSIFDIKNNKVRVEIAIDNQLCNIIVEKNRLEQFDASEAIEICVKKELDTE